MKRGEMCALCTRPHYGALHWLCVLLVLAPFCVGLGFLYPRGDDFDFATRCAMPFDILSGLYEPLRQWAAFSGRYFHHFIAVFLGKAVTMPAFYALVCGSVLALHGYAMFRLLELVRPALHLRDRLFCAVLWLALLCCCYQNLPTFYMYTDTLSMGLQSALTMLFCASLGRVWEKTGTVKNCVFWAFVACGCYEHSALAVVMTACLVLLLAWWDRENDSQRLRRMLTVGGASLFFLCISFLAPGNFLRGQKLGVDASRKLIQLYNAPNDWLTLLTSFVQSQWIPIVFLFLVCVLLTRGKTGKPCPTLPKFIFLLPILLWIVFSLFIAIVHSQSDVPVLAASKLPAGINYYGALCLGWSLYLLWGRLSVCNGLKPAFAAFGSSCRYLVLCACLLVAWQGNLPPVLAQILVGNYQALGHTLDERYTVLRETGLSSDPDHDDRLGVVTRILHPEVRKRRIDFSLPQMVVQKIMLPPIYPMHMGEAMPSNPEEWPNLWVAWLYGVGSTRSALPDKEAAIVAAESGRNNSKELEIPTNWREQGIGKGWLVTVDGGAYLASRSVGSVQHVGFRNLWLVLKRDNDKSSKNMTTVAVLRPHTLAFLNSLPSELATSLLSDILHRSGYFGALLSAAAVASFATDKWQTGNYCAVPLDPGVALNGNVAGIRAKLGDVAAGADFVWLPLLDKQE